MNFQRWFLLLAGFASACSGGAELWNDGGVDAKADVKPGNDASESDVTILGDAGSDTGVTGDAGSDAQSADLGCLTDDAGCVSCCFNNHPDGAATYFGTLTTCACSTGAPCHSVSKCYSNLCKGGDPSASCDQCLSNPDAGDCYNNADKACSNDPDCVAFFDCALNVCSPPGDAGAD
jgi:hypothetical protein